MYGHDRETPVHRQEQFSSVHIAEGVLGVLRRAAWVRRAARKVRE